MQKAVFYPLKGRVLQAKRRLFATPLIINGLRLRSKPSAAGTQKGVATLVRAATPYIERVIFLLYYFFLVVISTTPFLAASPYLSVVCLASLYMVMLSISLAFMLLMSSTGLPSTT